MTRQELRVVLGEWFCGCGSPEVAASRLRDVLALHPLHSNRKAFKVLVPDDGLEELLLYTLDHFGLTEHGGTVGGAWLSDKGTAVLAALNREAGDKFEVLFANACLHGYAVDDPEELRQCPECGPIAGWPRARRRQDRSRERGTLTRQPRSSGV